MSIQSKLRTAAQDPERATKYAYEKTTEPLREAATWWRTRGLPDQHRMLDGVRARDEYVLVVLDACRWDYFQEEALGLFDCDATPMESAGYDTFQYAQECWGGEHPGVTYVSGATPIGSDGGLDFDDQGLKALYEGYRPDDHIGEIVDAWAEYWDPSLGTVPPEPVSEHAVARSDESELVCHLFQPHAPYIGDEMLLGHTDDGSSIPGCGEPVDAPLWRRVKSGDVSDEQLEAAYRSNLQRALDATCWLINELNRDVVIIGDHGEALGEYGIYSHPRTAHPKIRTVPYCEVCGLTPRGQSRVQVAERRLRDTGATGAGGGAREKLEALGYL